MYISVKYLAPSDQGAKCESNEKDDPFYLVQTLTDQEKLIMEYVIEGKSSNDISQILFRSVHTIKTHRRNLLNKLGSPIPLN